MKFNIKYLIALIPLSITLLLIYWFSNIVSYVIIAWAISMIGAPIVTYFRKYMGKNAAAGITLTMFILFGVFLLYLFIPPLLNQARYLSTMDYNKVVGSIEQPLHDWENWLKEKGLMTYKKDLSANSEIKEDRSPVIVERKIHADSVDHLGKNISITVKLDVTDLKSLQEGQISKQNEEADKDFFEKLRETLLHYLNPKIIPEFFTATVSAFGNILVGIFSVLFISFFFLREQGLFYNMIQSVVPVAYEEKSSHAINEISNLLVRYLTGILLQMICITLLVAIPLSIMGMENALLIAFFAAFLNVIPYIGPIVGTLFGIVITISSNPSMPFYSDLMPELIKMIVVFAVMHLIDNLVLQPIIFSKSVKAHPLEIFLVVLIGANVGGILGMVLAIPLYTVFRVVAKVFLSEFKIIQSLTRNI